MNEDAKSKNLNVRQQEEIKDKETSKQAIAFLVAEIDDAAEQERNSVIPKLQVELSKAYHDEFMQERNRSAILITLAFITVNFLRINVWTDSVLESDLIRTGFYIFLSIVFFQNFSNRGYVVQILPNTRQKTKFEIDRITYVLWGVLEKFKIKTFSFFTSALFVLLVGSYFFTNSFIYSVIVQVVNFNIVVFYIFMFKTTFIQTQKQGK